MRQITRGGLYGLTTTWSHDANGRVTRMETGITQGGPTPSSSLTRQFAYDSLNALTRVTANGPGLAADENFVEYINDYASNTTTTRTPNSQVVTHRDERDLPYKIVRGLDNATATEFVHYDANGNSRQRVDANQHETTFTYDGYDRLIRATDALGNSVEYLLDPLGNATEVTFRGPLLSLPGSPHVVLAQTKTSFDELSRPYVARALVTPTASGAQWLISRTEFDAASRVTYAVDPRAETDTNDNHTTQMEYDGASRLVKQTDPLGNQTLSTYDPNGNAVRVASLELNQLTGATSTYVSRVVYDELDRPIRTVDPAGNSHTYTYDSRSNVVLQTDAEGPGQLSLTLPGADGAVESVTVNDLGNTTTMTYDALDRLVRKIVSLRPDGLGPGGSRPEAGALPSGGLDTGNAANPDGLITLTYTYDADSRLVAMADDKGSTTQYTYDRLSRVVTRTLPDSSKYRYTYDAVGNVLTTTDPNGSLVSRAYDALNRLTAVDIEPGMGVLGSDGAQPSQGVTQQTFSYDGLSRLLEATDNGGIGLSTQSCSWVYDSLGRPLTESQNGRAVSSTWLPDGRRSALFYPGQRRLGFSHDANDRITTISDGPETGAPLIARNYWAGPGSRLVRRQLGPGSRIACDLAHDPALRVSGLRWTLDGSEILNREYEYNRTGFRLSERRVEDGGLTDSYRYDSAQRLVGATNQSTEGDSDFAYSLDGVGNRATSTRAGVSQSYVSNALNQYEQIDGLDQVHDPNGNLVADGTHRFVYDALDRLCQVRELGSDKLIAAYAYLPDGRRSRAQIRVPSSQQIESDVRFYYDGGQEIELTDVSGQTLTTFVWGSEYIDALLEARRHLAGSQDPSQPLGSFYPLTDVRHSIVGYLDAAGATREKLHYEDYGASVVTEGTDLGFGYGFQGRRFDPETGLYYFRARYYDPHTGRFTQRDAASDPTNLGNAYTFVGNSPLSLMDPSGMLTAGDAWEFSGGADVETASRGAYGEWKAGSKLLAVGLAAAAVVMAIDAATNLVPLLGAAKGALKAGLKAGARRLFKQGGKQLLKEEAGQVAGKLLKREGVEAAERFVRQEGRETGEALAKQATEECLPCIERVGCFLAGTMVSAREGSKPIEQVKAGDLVLSRDEATGEQGYKRVVRLFRGHTDQVVYLRIAKAASTQRGRGERHRVGQEKGGSSSDGEDGSDPDPADDGEQTIRSTVGHPYFVEGRGWVHAKDLNPGDQFRGTDGEALYVVSMEIKAEEADHYNFEVEDYHTYFVAGELNAPAVWVHNACGPGHGPDLYHMVDAEADFFAKGWVEDGVLKMSLNVRREITVNGQTIVQRGFLRGHEEFQAILKHFEGRFDRIRGVWTEAMPDNLKVFNSLVKSQGATAAARATKTGQWAVEAGYTAVYPRLRSPPGPGPYSHVEVDFMLPRSRR